MRTILLILLMLFTSCRAVRKDSKYNTTDKTKRMFHFHIIVGGTFYGHYGDYQYRR